MSGGPGDDGVVVPGRGAKEEKDTASDPAAMEEGKAVSGAAASKESEDVPGAAAGMEPARYVCDLCGNVMLDLHCKLVCERCGYKRDCSDP